MNSSDIIIKPPNNNKKQTNQSPSLLSLPDEIIVNCLARISKSYYPKLSLVCKSFRDLILSKDLCLARLHLGTTQRYIYICLRFPNHESPRWFSLLMNPNQALPGGKETSRNNEYLVPIPCSKSYQVSKSTVAVGSKIYVLGGGANNNVEPSSTSTVRVLDCHNHTWTDAPSMKVARKDAVVGVLNGKIFVFGGCDAVDESTRYWGEVFDTKTQTWEPLPSPPPGEVRRGGLIKKMVEFEGKCYVNVSRGGVSYVYAYDPEESKWECCGGEHNHWMIDKTCCVINNVLYCYGSFGFKWYDNIESSGKYWRNVKGLEEVQSMFRNSGGLRVRAMFEANNGGKLVMFWDGVGRPGPSRTRNRNIWCAEIALERRDHEGGGEIWGKLEWVDVVLTVPNSYEFMRCLAISV